MLAYEASYELVCSDVGSIQTLKGLKDSGKNTPLPVGAETLLLEPRSRFSPHLGFLEE